MDALQIKACNKNNDINKQLITSNSINKAVPEIEQKNPNANKDHINKCVKHVASLWRSSDGSNIKFVDYCSQNYIGSDKVKDLVFKKL